MKAARKSRVGRWIVGAAFVAGIALAPLVVQHAGIVVVQLGGFVAKDDVGSPDTVYGTPTAVLELENEEWKIIAFQNTPFVVDEYRAYGNLRRFKAI